MYSDGSFFSAFRVYPYTTLARCTQPKYARPSKYSELLPQTLQGSVRATANMQSFAKMMLYPIYFLRSYSRLSSSSISSLRALSTWSSEVSFSRGRQKWLQFRSLMRFTLTSSCSEFLPSSGTREIYWTYPSSICFWMNFSTGNRLCLDSKSRPRLQTLILGLGFSGKNCRQATQLVSLTVYRIILSQFWERGLRMQRVWQLRLEIRLRSLSGSDIISSGLLSSGIRGSVLYFWISSFMAFLEIITLFLVPFGASPSTLSPSDFLSIDSLYFFAFESFSLLASSLAGSSFAASGVCYFLASYSGFSALFSSLSSIFFSVFYSPFLSSSCQSRSKASWIEAPISISSWMQWISLTNVRCPMTARPSLYARMQFELGTSLWYRSISPEMCELLAFLYDKQKLSPSSQTANASILVSVKSATSSNYSSIFCPSLLDSLLCLESPSLLMTEDWILLVLLASLIFSIDSVLRAWLLVTKASLAPSQG